MLYTINESLKHTYTQEKEKKISRHTLQTHSNDIRVWYSSVGANGQTDWDWVSIDTNGERSMSYMNWNSKPIETLNTHSQIYIYMFIIYYIYILVTAWRNCLQIVS